MNLKINDRIKIRDVEFFNNFSLNRKYDSIASTFSFSFLFDPLNEEHRELACISHYHECTIEHNGELLLTGCILSQAPSSSDTKQMMQIAGYSKPGVLEDCEIPYSSYPLESINLSLKQIAEKLIAPFGLKMVIDPSVKDKMNINYEKTTAKETDSVKGYLTDLATQRDIIISHNEKGELLFTKAKANKIPILHFEPGANSIPFTKMEMVYNGQPMHSEITVVKQASSKGGNEGKATIKNPFVPIVYRPKLIMQNSGDDNNTSDVAKNALAAEIKEGVRLVITTDRWEVEGSMIKENNIITVKNPELYLFQKSYWFIESIGLVGNSESTIATLTCVLPEVYNGGTFKNIFVDAHQNFARI